MNDAIEAHAEATGCPRHIQQMRACAWENNRPCYCREKETLDRVLGEV